jgi:hypothetical protein
MEALVRKPRVVAAEGGEFMKRVIFTTLLAALIITTMSGCGALIAMGGGGIFYQDTKQPSSALAYYGPTTSQGMKTGNAQFTSILGILVTGDASLDAAMRAGGITKLHHVDTQITSILGIITTYKLIVFGE